MSKIIPIVMCGGAGTRLWPASRESMPKQFISLLGEQSSFQTTMLRIAPSDLFSKSIVLTSEDFRFVVADQLRQVGLDADIVLEPMRRDSGPAIAVASVLALQRDPDALLLVLASDHAIQDVGAFYRACREATPIAQQGRIVTFGIVPTEPATGFGYLKPGAHYPASNVRQLEAFAEKPDKATAATYIQAGFLWNSGNFLFRAATMKAEFSKYRPAIWSAADRAVAQAARDADFIRLNRPAFADAPQISIDYAIMEKTRCSAVLGVDLGWSDLGSWDAIWSHAPRDPDGNATVGPCELIDVKDTLVRSDGTLTTVVGLSNLVVVTCSDAVLVAPRSVDSALKLLVERLKSKHCSEAIVHRKSFHPWGSCEVVYSTDDIVVSRILVSPGAKFDANCRAGASKHWIVVRGMGDVKITNDAFSVVTNSSIVLNDAQAVAVTNTGSGMLDLVEVAFQS